MDRDDCVAGVLEIRGYAVTRPIGFAAQAYNRDAPRLSDKLRQLGSGGRHPSHRSMVLRMSTHRASDEYHAAPAGDLDRQG
jgi:hypothetical protein